MKVKQTPIPKHIQAMVDKELKRDRERGNDFWRTPITKAKLAAITESQWKQVLKMAKKLI